MPKPKFVKPLLIGVACTIPVGLVVGLSVNWDHTQYISAVGSSGVKPFIENFGKQYHKQFKQFDVTVESGGTTFAVEELAKGYTNLGNASNNPYWNIMSEGYDKQWAGKKTLTLGWEGLCVMYSLPENLSQDGKNKFEIVFTRENILKLYAVFSSIYELPNNEPWDHKYENLLYYCPDDIQATLSDNDKQILNTTKILPFVRAGGNTGANSSIAFSCYSNLAEFTDMTEAQQKAYAGGQYGDDGEYMETDESNSRAWQSFVTKDKPGSMVYLTTSFLTNEDNRKQIKEHGYKLAQYKRDNNVVKFDLDNVTDSLGKIARNEGYNWYRPINVMIDLNTQKSKDFLYWIYFNNNQEPTTYSVEYLSTVLSLGANPLTQTQFVSMMPSGQLFQGTSDIELAEVRAGTDYAQVYGACDIWE